MPDSIIEDMDMNDATTKESKHGRVTHPASRGSYAMDQGLLLEWHVHALEGGKNFPDYEGGPAHDFPSVDYPPANMQGITAPPADGLILSGGQNDARECLNYTDADIEKHIRIKDPAVQSSGWPRLPVKGMKEFTVTWDYAAEHVTRGYRWFITKEGWDESKPITREAFRGKNYVTDNHFKADGQDGLMWSDISPLSPFDKHRDELQPAEITKATLPSDKHGHHVILLAWIVAETDKAFYQAFDVDFDVPVSGK
ncbi:lytic polysaccharide monooxygenase [Pseudomonas syringae pv. aptata]|uniref:Chitin-binding protein n=1 Tax=Pseudomonas syringae TaxID=317 RepID=A0A6B2ATS3_PSESX|nr:lytic polysaccharide monooxygenase auxiliary activity family 9 protein [Pseudomonas syringae]MBI6557886.1 lytic polysaccharide monooxygenase [Pseudomonas syringae]MBI6572069.1 lytic polysaccharide monooxygenase [Pseudomonas syringae]MBI6588744.1 lytic polysaccharide monooxygenase [Pseudomonas syringae]MBI6595790.1 lytic polysaccharide monooxygenase [Pseudomonas syringae]MCK0542648.1 lytic polysaccharide monooxygenase [Pseudomonas syringae pv. aptata]